MLAIGTGLRVVLCPVILGLLLSGSRTAAAIVFFAAASTDWFDGRLARRWGVTTRLGALLDTTADKLLVTTALTGLVAIRFASPWVALVILGREFTILGLRAASASAQVNFKTSMFGKWKATIQFAAMTLAMLRPDVVIAGAYLDQWAMAIAAIITGWSGIDYMVRFSAALRGEP